MTEIWASKFSKNYFCAKRGTSTGYRRKSLESEFFAIRDPQFRTSAGARRCPRATAASLCGPPAIVDNLLCGLMDYQAMSRHCREYQRAGRKSPGGELILLLTLAM
jgi:hypothetical protein